MVFIVLRSVSALAVAAAKILSVDVSEPSRLNADDHLRGRLVRRLVEEGCVIVPSSSVVATQLHVVVSTAAVSLEARGDREARTEVSYDGSPLAQLEVLQSSLVILERAGIPRVPADPSLRIAAVRWLASREDNESSALLERLELDLLAAGFAVADRRIAHDVELCLARIGPALTLSASATDCEHASDAQLFQPAPKETKAELFGRLALRAVSLARDAVSPGPTIRLRDPVAIEPSRTDAAIEAHAGVLAHGAIDPVVALGGGVRVSGRLGGASIIALSPSSAGGAGRVLELIAAAGPSLELPLVEDVGLELGALGGVRWHRFSIDGEPSGGRIDWIALASARLSYEWRAPFALEFRGLLGLSGRSRVHRLEGVEVWRREAWMLGTTLGLRIAI